MEALSSLVRRDSGINSSSLTFGFSFMGILLFMLIAASLLQRHITARERLERMRLGLAVDGLTAELFGLDFSREEVPKLWDVHVQPSVDRTDLGSQGVDERGSARKRPGKELRDAQDLKWKDIQPLAAHELGPWTPSQHTSPRLAVPRLWPSKPTTPFATDPAALQRMPTHVSVLIAMPISPMGREAPFPSHANSSEKPMMNSGEPESREHSLYYEIGIAEVTKR